MSDIRILGRKSSVNVLLVLWTLDELNLAYQRVDAGFTYGVVDTDAFKQMNPNGLVPVLIDGDAQPIFESASVLRYLANQYGDDVSGQKMRQREPRSINGANGQNGILVIFSS